ncbi:hypothetical protein HNP46_000025 [Pseudomonas nitritireducens]|uniref:Uncharacterized protein n=1 Tax=Pseudomonas nitroreducens TaxID=46680 RepID=A0A7W7NZ37_PSENT|nr:hypothetical protein [Pseudomonas nitritireducens]MBB4861214.1 hypothetical protein [Pseudomonas nitritireducens]
MNSKTQSPLVLATLNAGHFGPNQEYMLHITTEGVDCRLQGNRVVFDHEPRARLLSTLEIPKVHTVDGLPTKVTAYCLHQDLDAAPGRLIAALQAECDRLCMGVAAFDKAIAGGHRVVDIDQLLENRA